MLNSLKGYERKFAEYSFRIKKRLVLFRFNTYIYIYGRLSVIKTKCAVLQDGVPFCPESLEAGVRLVSRALESAVPERERQDPRGGVVLVANAHMATRGPEKYEVESGKIRSLDQMLELYGNLQAACTSGAAPLAGVFGPVEESQAPSFAEKLPGLPHFYPSSESAKRERLQWGTSIRGGELAAFGSQAKKALSKYSSVWVDTSAADLKDLPSSLLPAIAISGACKGNCFIYCAGAAAAPDALIDANKEISQTLSSTI